jgi:hypothetical protein
MKLDGQRGVRSPLQLFGLYLAWSESAIAAGLFATVSVEHWTRQLLIAVMAFGLVAYVLVAGFLLIYLVVKRPGFLNSTLPTPFFAFRRSMGK